MFEIGSKLGIAPFVHGLVGYWKFDEGSGTTANDSSGFGYNGILTDGPTWTTGKINSAISLDGLNDRVQNFPSSTPFRYVGGNMTLMAWFKPHINDADAGNIFSKPWNGSGEYNYMLTLNSNDTLTLDIRGSTAWSVNAPPALSAGNWHHLAFTINASKAVNIYIDGSLVKDTAHNIADWNPLNGDLNQSFLLGCLYPYGAGWAGNTGYCVQGDLDEVFVYNSRSLSAAEIKAIYNATK